MSVIVTLEHLATVTGFNARPGFCRPMARRWCAQHGVDWNEFRKHGIDGSELLATGDPMAAAVVRHAEKMEATRGR